MALHYAKIYQNVWAIAVHCWRKFRADILTRSEMIPKNGVDFAHFQRSVT